MEFIDDKKDAGQSQRSNVIVRVKRKRTEEPTNSLCIVEDVRERKRIGLSNKLAELSTNDTDTPTRVLMHRVATVEDNETHDLDNETLQTWKCQSQTRVNINKTTTTAQANGVKAKRRIMVTNKKRLRLDNDDDANSQDDDNPSKKALVVVDMLSSSSSSASSSSKRIRNKSPTVTEKSSSLLRGKPIMDPFTSALQDAMHELEALIPQILEKNKENKSQGEMNIEASVLLTAITETVKQGAKVDHQLSGSGLSPLMASVILSDIRATKNLLTEGASVLLKDSNNISALQHAEKACNLRSEYTTARQILGLIQRATMAANDDLNEDTDAEADAYDFVYDVFVSESIPSQPTSKGTDNINENQGLVGETMKIEGEIEAEVTVAVPGVRFGAGMGCEIVFDYDSDWSDLADDEDPDSNDERFFGNDYPDEEDDDDADSLFGSDEDGDRIQNPGKGYKSDNSYDLEESDEDDDLVFDGQDTSFRGRSMNGTVMNGSNSTNSSAGIGKTGISLRQHFFNSRNQGKSRVGHVMRNYPDSDGDDETEDNAYNNGVGSMDMGYRDKLPRYGNDLSDDDDAYLYENRVTSYDNEA